jgi:hypothetical protein
MRTFNILMTVKRGRQRSSRRASAPVEVVGQTAYFERMGFGRILHIFALLALLLAPAGMLGSHAAMAMPSGTPASSTLDHCSEKQAPDEHDRRAMLDCAIACTALPAAAPLLATGQPLVAPLLIPAAELRFVGTRPEAATPPPRFS